MKLTNKQIDDIFGNSPFIVRLSEDKNKYELVQQENDDWEEVITNEPLKHHGYFDTWEKAVITKNRLHARWVLDT